MFPHLMRHLHVARRGRNVVERRFSLLEHRALATRYDKFALADRSAVVLQAVTTWTKELSDAPQAELWITQHQMSF